MPEQKPRNPREDWKNRVAKWGPLCLALARWLKDGIDQLLG
ncbi:hypothetical protein [Nocardia takedensis]|nr:hypothetical protein [Nocardia takedensis]